MDDSSQVEQRDSSQVEQLQYQLVAERRSGTNTMMWQVPVLSLTAQAFLFTIVFNPGVSPGFRVLAGMLSLTASLASLQLMAKHRLLETMDSRWLQDFEESRQQQGYQVLHARPALPEEPSLLEQVIGYSSYRVWMGLLAVFALAAFLSQGVIASSMFLQFARKLLGYEG